MPKSDLTLTFGDYATVAERIALFYARHPDGRIITELVAHEKGRVIVKAEVYRSTSEAGPAATGWAAEREGDGDINTVACVENTETSAIGRALANLGFAASARRPSVEEMISASRRRARPNAARGVAEREPSSAVEGQPTPSTNTERAVPRQPSPSGSAAAEALAQRADEVMDLVDLLRSAQRLGFPPGRADVIRRRAIAGDLQPKRLARLARSVRLWMRRGVVRTLLDEGRPPPPG